MLWILTWVETVEIIENEQKTVGERLIAFDHLELLVEQIDNGSSIQRGRSAEL